MSSPGIVSPEDVLARLGVLLGGMPGITKCYRDRGDLEAEILNNGSRIPQLPAVLLYQNSATYDMDQPVPKGRDGFMPPAFMLLRPEIFVICRERDRTDNETLNGASNPISAELESWRNAVDAAVTNDAVLAGLLGRGGQIIYRGWATDMHSSGPMLGRLEMMYEFRYMWKPQQG